jgi:hypothetical protein
MISEIVTLGLQSGIIDWSKSLPSARLGELKLDLQKIRGALIGYLNDNIMSKNIPTSFFEVTSTFLYN